MAIDTRQKRRSIVNMRCPWRRTLPAGDGTIDQGDRQQVLGYYSGILWSEDLTSFYGVLGISGLVAIGPEATATALIPEATATLTDTEG